MSRLPLATIEKSVSGTNHITCPHCLNKVRVKKPRPATPELIDRLATLRSSIKRTPKATKAVLKAIDQLQGVFTFRDVMDRAPGISQRTARNTLQRLHKEGYISCQRGSGAFAPNRWEKAKKSPAKFADLADIWQKENTHGKNKKPS